MKTRFDRKGSHERLRLLGFRPEGVLHHYGTDRGHYLQMAYLLPAEEAQGEAVPEEREPVSAA